MLGLEIDGWLAFQLILSFSCLGAGALKDLVDRSVANGLWLVYGGVALGAAVLQFGFSVLLGVHLLFAFLISLAYFLAWTRLKRYLGGADVKAIMALSVSLSYLAVEAIAWSVVLALAYLSIVMFRDRLTKKEVLALQVPFLPFLFLGFLFTAAGFILA